MVELINYHPTISFLTIFGMWGYICIYSIKQKKGIPWRLLFALISSFVTTQLFILGFILQSVFFISLIIFFTASYPLSKYEDYFITLDNPLKSFIEGGSIGILLSAIIIYINNQFIKIDAPTIILTRSISGYLLITAISVCEELLFRGLLLGHLIEIKVQSWVSILLQTFLFTLFHSRFTLNQDFFHIGIIIILGIVTGQVTLLRKNIISPICIHVILNIAWNVWAK